MIEALHVSQTLDLPLDTATGTCAMIAVRGAGKTNAATVMAESLYAAEIPFVVIDPVGSWYGLRAGRDGRKEGGLDVIIFGGKHQDVALDKSSGKFLGKLIAEKRISCILDLSDFEEDDKKSFLLDFATSLYRSNESPLHLFLEEADDYIPEKMVDKGDHLLVRAWKNIVRRGRGRGLGMTFITQRCADIAKSVFTQVETLFVLRTSGPQDIEAIRGWTKYHKVDTSIIETLASLDDGEAWVWSPHFLKKIERFRFRLRNTFDSGATPKNLRSKDKRGAAVLADIDLSAIRSEMALAVTQAELSDPTKLRNELAATMQKVVGLERDRAALGLQIEALRYELEPWREVKSMFTAEGLERLRGKKEMDPIERARLTMRSPDMLPVTKREVPPVQGTQDHGTREHATGAPGPEPRAPRAPSRAARAVAREPTIERRERHMNLMSLGRGPRAMMEALFAVHPHRLTRKQLATLSDLKSSTGSFATYLSILRKTWGYIEDTADKEIALTAKGLAAFEQKPKTPRTMREVLELYRPHVPGKVILMAEVLLEHHPMPLARSALANIAEMKASTGSFATYLSMLRINRIAQSEGNSFSVHPDLLDFERKSRT